MRWLAYTLKRWVKTRHLNDPSDSTLSSYGLLLMFFHFLQARRPAPCPVRRYAVQRGEKS